MKLKFWKHDEEEPPDFSSSPAPAQNLYGSDPLQQRNDPFQSPPQENFGGQDNFGHDIFSSATPTGNENAREFARGLGGQQSAPQQGHEWQLILERLDTIKAEIDSIKQRMMRIERFMELAEQKAGQRKYW